MDFWKGSALWEALQTMSFIFSIYFFSSCFYIYRSVLTVSVSVQYSNYLMKWLHMHSSMKCFHCNTLLELLPLTFIGKAIVQLVGCVLLICETQRWWSDFIFTEPTLQMTYCSHVDCCVSLLCEHMHSLIFREPFDFQCIYLQEKLLNLLTYNVYYVKHMEWRYSVWN